MSGIRLEDLLERFRNIKIEPTFIKREANKKYFRDIEISVKADLGKLFGDHGLIPNTGAATRTYNEKEGYIELETFYSEIIPRTDKERSELEDKNGVIILDEEIQKAMGIRQDSPFKDFPKERIKIYFSED